MSGPFYGNVECYASTGSQYNNLQEVWKNVYDFFVFLETQNVVAIRASFNGESALGTDFWDGPAPFRTHAFVLVEWLTTTTTPANPSYVGTRTEPFYTLAQFWRADQMSPFTGAGNGTPAALFGGTAGTVGGSSAGVCFQMAVGVGGDLYPWNGTSVLGSAAKGSPVWKDPASGGTGRYVFPRSNSPIVLGGTGGVAATQTLQQNLCRGVDSSSPSTNIRYHMIADHDGFFFANDANNNLYAWHYHGTYLPRPGITISHPYVMLYNTGSSGFIPMTVGNLYGDYTGTGAQLQGGIAFPTYGPEVRSCILGRLDETMNGALLQPNKLFSTPTYDELPITLGVFDYFGGYAGILDWIRETNNVANLEQSTDGRRIVLGSSATVTNQKMIVPWNNTVTPASGTTRTGVMGAFP